MARSLFHHNAEKVASVTAFAHHSSFHLIALQTCKREQAAVEPGFEQSLPVLRHTEIAKTRLKNVQDFGFGSIDGKVPGRKQRVIKIGRARARTPQNEYRRFAAQCGVVSSRR